MIDKPLPESGLRRAVGLVAALNLAYFGVEFAVALAIGSVSLFADSIDFLEDTSVNCLILVALAWSARWRARVGMALSGILLAPGLATLWTAWEKFMAPVPPQPFTAIADGSGGVRHQSYVRLRAGRLPPSQRQSDQGRLP